jgi:hypothetical protein
MLFTSSNSESYKLQHSFCSSCTPSHHYAFLFLSFPFAVPSMQFSASDLCNPSFFPSFLPPFLPFLHFLPFLPVLSFLSFLFFLSFLPFLSFPFFLFSFLSFSSFPFFLSFLPSFHSALQPWVSLSLLYNQSPLFSIVLLQVVNEIFSDNLHNAFSLLI